MRARSQRADKDQQTQKQRFRSRQDCSRNYWKWQTNQDINLSVCLTVGKLAAALLCALALCPTVVSLVLRRRLYAVQNSPCDLAEYEPQQ